MKIVAYFKTLADETRVRLLNILRRHELSVGEISWVLDMSQPRVSRHLKIMAEAGLLASRRDGLWIFYRAVQDGPGRDLAEAVAYLLDSEPALKGDLDRANRAVEERSRETTRFFNAIAKDWPDMRREILQDFDLPGAVAARLGACRVAADLGCGAGDLLPALKAGAERVIGVDSSPRMLDEARRRLDALGLPGEPAVSLRLGELEHLPLRDGEADCAVLSMVLHHLSGPAEGVAEAHRILRPGGRLIIIDFARHADENLRKRYGDRWLGFAPEDLDAWLSGFAVEERAAYDLAQGPGVILYTATKH
jgi:ArsR family transcriptional regulator